MNLNEDWVTNESVSVDWRNLIWVLADKLKISVYYVTREGKYAEKTQFLKCVKSEIIGIYPYTPDEKVYKYFQKVSVFELIQAMQEKILKNEQNT